MSWHFSQALVAAYSADTSSAGAPSAPLSGNPIPQAFLSPDRMTAFSRLSRFGMTFKPLTEDLGAAVLTWCLADSHARTSVQLGRAQESPESEAVCGHTWRELSVKFDPVSSSWKTHRCLFQEVLESSSLTLPRWGMMQDGELWERTMSPLPTSETESGLWVGTPTATMSCRSEEFAAGRLPQPAEFVKMWPTPTVCGNYNQKGMSATSGDGPATAVKMWPTLRCFMHKDALTDRGKSNLGEVVNQMEGMTITGQLNPTWVEWLMGWPLGWTDLKPLGMDKFQQWLGSHGKHSAEDQSK